MVSWGSAVAAERPRLHAGARLLAGLFALAPLCATASTAPPSWVEYQSGREAGLALRALLDARLEEAERHAGASLALDPDHTIALAVRTRARLGRKDWPGAHASARELVRVAPDDAEALELLGRAALEAGDATEAREAFGGLHRLQPTRPAALLGLALVAARLDDDQLGAIEALRQAVALDPGLDLTGLLLRPEWNALATNSSFVNALNGLLSELR